MKSCEWQRGEGNEIQFIGELDRMTVPALWKQRKNWLNGEQVLTLNLQGVTKIDWPALQCYLKPNAQC